MATTITRKEQIDNHTAWTRSLRQFLKSSDFWVALRVELVVVIGSIIPWTGRRGGRSLIEHFIEGISPTEVILIQFAILQFLFILFGFFAFPYLKKKRNNNR